MFKPLGARHQLQNHIRWSGPKSCCGKTIIVYTARTSVNMNKYLKGVHCGLFTFLFTVDICILVAHIGRN